MNQERAPFILTYLMPTQIKTMRHREIKYLPKAVGGDRGFDSALLVLLNIKCL